jgi:hypothetical protein
VVAASLTARRREVTAAWERYVHRGVVDQVRRDVADSWDRSARSLPGDVSEAPVDDERVVEEAWRSSPLRSGVAAIAADVSATAQDCDLVVAVTDPGGRILWTAGSGHMRDRAASVNFVPGGRWDEASVGTNALDLALRTGHTSSVFSAEHFSPCVHGWVCYAAPVRDPGTGEVLGVLDFSTTWDRSHPMAMAAVQAFARSLSQTLRPGSVRAGDPPRPRRQEPGPLRLHVLGRPRLDQSGVPLMVTLRQSEILLALAVHPDGLSLQQLHAHVYGDLPVSLGTLKSEMSRLRRAVGDAVSSRPYRLDAPISIDAVDVLAHVRRGEVTEAVAGYRAEVLPGSEAPIAAELRMRLEMGVRELVLSSRDAQAAALLAERLPDDLAVVEHALRLLPVESPTRAFMEALRTAALQP